MQLSKRITADFVYVVVFRFTPLPISAISGTGTGELLDLVCSGLNKIIVSSHKQWCTDGSYAAMTRLTGGTITYFFGYKEPVFGFYKQGFWREVLGLVKCFNFSLLSFTSFRVLSLHE